MVSVVAREERSQHRNRALALERLAGLLAAQAEIAAIAARQDVHMRHDQLERGRAIRRFRGQNFRPL